MNLKARILIVDDHPFIREGIRFYLRGSDSVEVVGEAADGQEAVRKALELSPDIIIMDLNLPVVDGLEATRRLLERRPEAKVLVLTLRQGPDWIRRVQESGARGYLSKESSPDTFVQAVEAVARGELFYCADPAKPEVPAGITEYHLTERELEVLVLLADGLSNAQIAERLQISPRTVEKHRQNVLARLRLHNMADLVRFAVAKGLVKLTKPGAVVEAAL